MWEDFYSIRRFLIACTKKMYLFSCHSDDGVRRISQKIRREYFLICSFFSFVAVQKKRTNQEKKTCDQIASLKFNLRLADSLRSDNARLAAVSLRDAKYHSEGACDRRISFIKYLLSD